MLSRLLRYLRMRRVFASQQDVRSYISLLTNTPGSSPAVPLKIRPLGGSIVWCRPETKDPNVLWATFHGRHHLPPKRLSRDSTVLDLGANVGYTVRHFGHLYPESRVVAVEMDGGNCSLAARNLKPLGNRARLIRAAVWTQDGEVTYEGIDEESFRVTDGGGVQTTEDVSRKRVPSMKIESILESCNLDRVDYVKMDIEGAEAHVLKGRLKWAKQVGCMKIEVHAAEDFDACMTGLKANGFRCWRDRSHWSCIAAVAR